MVNSHSSTDASLPNLLKVTAVGGLLFLLPLILVVFLLGQAVRIAGIVTQPISSFLTLDQVVGPVGERFIAVVGLVAIALAAGLVGRTRTGRRVKAGLEHSFLGGLPQYQMIKSMAEGLAHVETADGVTPALVSIEGGWQIGYLLEPINKGWVAVFLPQAPTPMSGNVMLMPAERVRPLEMTMAQAMIVIKNLGIGSAAALGNADLTVPEGAA